jgi:hypothetical protein
MRHRRRRLCQFRQEATTSFAQYVVDRIIDGQFCVSGGIVVFDARQFVNGFHPSSRLEQFTLQVVVFVVVTMQR